MHTDKQTKNYRRAAEPESDYQYFTDCDICIDKATILSF